MECLDQLNSNLVARDRRASTAALDRVTRCPVCDNRNDIGTTTTTSPRHNDNSKGVSPAVMTSPQSRPQGCTCGSRPSHSNTTLSTRGIDSNVIRQSSLSSSLESSSSSSSVLTSNPSTVTTMTARKSDLEDEARTQTDSPSETESDSRQDLPNQEFPLSTEHESLDHRDITVPNVNTDLPPLHNPFDQDAIMVQTDFDTTPSLSRNHPPHHHHQASTPIPIKPPSSISSSSAYSRHHHRARHHNDTDLTQGRSLTPSAYASGLPSSSWDSHATLPFYSSPVDRPSLHFYSQQSPKYFKQPSNPMQSPMPSYGRSHSRPIVPDTTPTVFDQWPGRSQRSPTKKPQRLGDSSTKPMTISSTTGTASPTTPIVHRGPLATSPTKYNSLFSWRKRLSGDQPKPRWRSRTTSGGDCYDNKNNASDDDDEDVPMVAVDGFTSSDKFDKPKRGDLELCQTLEKIERGLPQQLLCHLHDMEHKNEDLSAEVVYALESKGFVIHQVLGKGISSTVRRVVEKATGQEFAVKIIDISGEKGDADVVEQTKKDTAREIQVLRMCGIQKNIIELHDVFETPTFIFLVFELCRNGELFDYLTAVVSMSEKRTRIIMRQLLDAVQFIHENGVVHRDLKPENILLDEDYNIKVSDFGFAITVEKGEELTELCGTPGYLAPEVLAHSMYENVPGYGKEVDMWACGVIMYTLLCGAPPFWNRRQMMMLRAIMNADYHFNSPEWDDISDAPKNLIKKMLVVNPKERLTAREALAHPFFHSKQELEYRAARTYSIKILDSLVHELEKFKARRKFKAGVYCVMFYSRLTHLHRNPPPISMETLSDNPYSIKLIRKAIDTCAFSMYRHWVKRVDNQNRAALFEHTLREEWKEKDVSVTESREKVTALTEKRMNTSSIAIPTRKK